MYITTRWLSDYIDLNCPTDELVDLLTMRGLEVEGTWEVGSNFSGVVTARIRQVSAHPNADKLKICRVNDGQELFNVVCGAPNCREGLVVPFAKVGAKLPNGIVGTAKLRGIESFGMLVSKKELGLSEDHAGLYELPDDLELGQDIVKALDLSDTVIEISVTPNRPDCLSMIGVARELAAAYGRELKKPEVPFEAVGGQIDEAISVTIEDPDLCPRYTGILVKGIKVGPSPLWMAKRLEAAGVRSINNIVDITNFVNLECGQPLHAFDFDFLAGHKIIVRRAKAGEKIVTLDEQERVLDDETLLICDGEKPVAVAGVMGGQNSLVADDTTDVFIESAYFFPPNIRRTSKRLALSTESSYRFERGIDIEGVDYGLHRCARLMEQYGGGKIVPGFIDNYPGKMQRETVVLRPERANWLLGTELTADRMKALLESIELSVQKAGDYLAVTIPRFRVDIDREVDLIEEIARLYGYEKIKPTLPATQAVSERPTPAKQLENNARRSLVSLGLFETVNFAFTTGRLLDLFHEKPGRYVKLQNPLNEEYAFLRDNLLVGLCQNVSANLKRQAKQVGLFEVRRVYLPADNIGVQPDERLHCAVIMAGRKEPEGWAQGNEDVDFFDIKGVAESFFDDLGLCGKVIWKKGRAPYLKPGMTAQITYDDAVIGTIGALSDRVKKQFDIDLEVYVMEIDLTTLSNYIQNIPEYRKLSRFPITTRDIAILVENSLEAGPIKDRIFEVSPNFVRDVICFDVYKGKKIGDNLKSLAFSIRMQMDESEVSESEADTVMKKVLETLAVEYKAKLRE